MPKYKISAQLTPRQVRPDTQVRYNYAVHTVRALPGGKFESSGEFQCGPDIGNAKAAADRLQREFDDDCDPCRTYVFRSNDMIPVYAGLQPQSRRYYRG